MIWCKMCCYLLLICWRFIVILGECIVPCNAIPLLYIFSICPLYILSSTSCITPCIFSIYPLHHLLQSHHSSLYISPYILSISSWASCASLPIGAFSILSHAEPSLFYIHSAISQSLITVHFPWYCELGSLREKTFANFTLCWETLLASLISHHTADFD